MKPCGVRRETRRTDATKWSAKNVSVGNSPRRHGSFGIRTRDGRSAERARAHGYDLSLPETHPGSCRPPFVAMMESADLRDGDDFALLRPLDGAAGRRVSGEGEVAPGAMVIPRYIRRIRLIGRPLWGTTQARQIAARGAGGMNAAGSRHLSAWRDFGSSEKYRRAR
jgi:hypothetical protein